MKNTKILTFANQKGGTAKTSTNHNLGTELARQDIKSYW